jgi:hypothetical protein
MTKREGWNPLLRSYPQSEKINAVSLGAETLFTRLLAQCDDHANYYADPCLILAYLYGHRMKANLPDSHRVSVTDVERFRNELVTVALVKPYQADGHWYLHVVNCKKTLRSDIKEDSRFPLEPQVENWERLTACDTDSLRMRAEFGSSSVDGDGDGAVDSTESREREREGAGPVAQPAPDPQTDDEKLQRILSLSFSSGLPPETAKAAVIDQTAEAIRLGATYQLIAHACKSPKANGSTPWQRIKECGQKVKQLLWDARNDSTGMDPPFRGHTLAELAPWIDTVKPNERYPQEFLDRFLSPMRAWKTQATTWPQ